MRKIALLCPTLLFFFLTAHTQINLNQGLKAYYPFSGNANDVSGNNNNPTFNNATLTADRFGNPNAAYHFNGTNNYMQIPNNPSINFTNKISLVSWVKITGFYAGTCHGNRIIMKGDTEYAPGNYFETFDDNASSNSQNCNITNPDIARENFFGQNTTQPPGGYTPYIQTNQWYCVIYTCDGNRAKLYVNCELKAEGPQGNMTFTNNADLYFGKLAQANYPYWLNGDLDEVRIYDRALTLDEIHVLSDCSSFACNNWLGLPTEPSYVNVGNLNITGNKITVEATINRTQPYLNGTGNGNEGDIVSKHTDPSDVNYLLRPNHAYITTTNGFFATPDICDIELNKTYHVAMVYDGATLKFYRDGFLMSQTPATGNLFQNSWPTRIGRYTGGVTETFLGYINEVRIWNVARTQGEIQAMMNISIPSPTTQTGLQAYYTFDNLVNKQGNAAWNGTLGGGATINNTNPNCVLRIDSCSFATPISNVINKYTPVTGFDPCKNIITVGDASNFFVGDTVLMIQMKGAVVDSTNTAAFGTITDYKNAGNYEFNYVKSITGNKIELLNTLTRAYDVPNGVVQLIRVPYYQNANITATLTCQPWNGTTGGVLVLNAADSVVMNADIDVSGKGFRGGIDPFSNPSSFNCYENQFFYPQNPDLASGKGEGIALISNAKSFGKGALANGGGGGNSHNSAGAGGGNGGNGGMGGYQYEGTPCDGTVPFDNRGISGKVLSYSNAANKIFLGGGGGAGHSNNPEAFQAIGGNGSAIVIIMADKIKSNNKKIIANGNAGTPCGLTTSGCHEGMGGGGGGGSVLLNINNYIGNTSVEAKGGKGADMTAAPFFKVGPGGGGGGGTIWLNNATLPAAVTASTTGGANGVCTGYANDPWGATPGSGGVSLFNLQMPVDAVPFKANIDSVRFNFTAASCNGINFFGLAYINSIPVSSWQWYFGDGGTAITQNTSHTYGAPGTYTVKLVVTDNNGCKDSISKPVIIGTCDNASGIINDYTPVLNFDPCKNILTVGDASKFNVGDTVLMIQMKGAVIDSTNTAAFGTITNYKNAGNYEFNYVKSKTGNNIELKNVLTRNYDIPNGKVQLVRVPYYTDITVSATLKCLPWDGAKGGILVFNVANTLTLNANMDVSGSGFMGGQVINVNANVLNCGESNYFYPTPSTLAAPKGESIAILSTAKTSGMGVLASGGGGGMDHNSGGGGGGNGGIGGFGGSQYDACPIVDNRGIGGKVLSYTSAANKIFLGGGGGAGHCNQPGGMNLNGGNGGGIVLVHAGTMVSNGFSIISNGANAIECTNSDPNACNDGSGGGGAGGTVLLDINTYTGTANITAKGGKGASLYTTINQGRVGPGGGGGGGAVLFSQPGLPANVTTVTTGGANGVIILDGNNTYGTSPGLAGINSFGLIPPVDIVPFKINIDSVRFNFATATCNTINFFGLAYINSTPVASWQWYFGDGGTANTQNTSHQYGAPGTYTVKLVVTDNNGCKDSISKPVTVTPVSAFDFSYKQDVCNPLSVQFYGNGASLVNPYWSFGDVSTTTGTVTPTHVYTAPGNYLVRFTVNNAVCNDTISKTIHLNIVPADIVITPDTTICFGTTKLLRAQASDNFCWSPTTFLTNPNSITPVTSTPQNITYYYTSEVLGTNLVTNGGFSAGNTGFTSDYQFTATNAGQGEYFVGFFPSVWNPTFTNCAVRGTVGNKMLMVNGSTTPDKVVWKQTVTVAPNTDYLFSTWITSLTAASPAQLSFAINGIPVGNTITASQPPCSWNRFSASWNSGSNTSITLSIIDKNVTDAGNDFGLTDISFATFSIQRDSVKITVDKPAVTVGGTNSFCYGVKNAQIVATGSAGMNTFLWSPATGLSNPNIANPVVTMLPGTTVFTVTGTTVNNCSAQASISVTVMPSPTVTITPDTTICTGNSVSLLATGGNSYTWTPAATLNNASIPNPVATPVLPATKYYVTVHDFAVNGCGTTDSVTVTLKAPPVFTISPADATCDGTAIQLLAGGGNKYDWSPASLVTNPAIPNPFTNTHTTTTYSVLITDNICNQSKTLTTVVTVNPTPQVTATKSNDIDCSTSFANLLATGASGYSWTPATGLNSPIVSNPVATPVITTQYVVTGTNSFGCTNTASVTVAVVATGSNGYFMPNSFTPNGDGKNDCFGIKNWGLVQELYFIIYNRYGEKVFETRDPNVCWNGKYKTDKPEAGNYVYYIKAKTACGDVERKGNVILIK